MTMSSEVTAAKARLEDLIQRRDMIEQELLEGANMEDARDDNDNENNGNIQLHYH